MSLSCPPSSPKKPSKHTAATASASLISPSSTPHVSWTPSIGIPGSLNFPRPPRASPSHHTPYFCRPSANWGSPETPPPPPPPVLWRAQSTLRDAISILSISGLTVYLLPHHSSPDATYTDGSKLGDPPSSGASAVLPGGTVAVCRVPEVPNSYKAELVGALLGSSLSPDGQRISLDCQGAIAAVHSRRCPVRQAFWVHKVRSC